MPPVRSRDEMPPGWQPHAGPFGRSIGKGLKGPGRPKGSLNKVTKEARLFASSIVDDPIYRANLLARAQTGTLAPAIEAMLWHYAKGKPHDKIDVNVSDTTEFTDLSTQEIAERIVLTATRAARIVEVEEEEEYRDSDHTEPN